MSILGFDYLIPYAGECSSFIQLHLLRFFANSQQPASNWPFHFQLFLQSFGDQLSTFYPIKMFTFAQNLKICIHHN